MCAVVLLILFKFAFLTVRLRHFDFFLFQSYAFITVVCYCTGWQASGCFWIWEFCERHKVDDGCNSSGYGWWSHYNHRSVDGVKLHWAWWRINMLTMCI